MQQRGGGGCTGTLLLFTIAVTRRKHARCYLGCVKLTTPRVDHHCSHKQKHARYLRGCVKLTTTPRAYHACLGPHRLVGLVVKASASRVADLGLIPAFPPFCRSSHSGDLKIGTRVAILPGAWRYRVSAGTGWPDVNIL